MHWDLRLEMDGTLVSFAVPKGITLDKAEKRLAMLTEDHPLDYACFEGVIPQGNYGAGAMILWDRGRYTSVEPVSPRQQLADGKLDLVFDGLKMRGRWALVRIKAEQDGKHWLLFHKPARGTLPQTDLALEMPHSILSGLTVHQLADSEDRTAALAAAATGQGAPASRLDAATLRPMLAESAPGPFSREGWIFEIKQDGIRALVQRFGPGDVRIYTRAGREVSASFPEVARAARHLPVAPFIVDGELVATDARGISRFELLQQRLGVSDPAALARAEVDIPITLHAFDLLMVANCDVRNLPVVRRKALLQTMVPTLGVIRYQDHLETEGEILFDQARRHDMEGVVGKRAQSTYQDGKRSADWVKIKPVRTADVVVVGANPSKSQERDLGALMVAWWKDGQLVQCGRVGSGLDHDTRNALWPLLQQARTPERAFVPSPEPPERGSFNVTPTLVVEVRYQEVTAAGQLRFPVFQRLRPDRDAADCHAPTARPAETESQLPAQVQPQERAVAYTNLDKVYFPRDGYTKGDLIKYYEAAWPFVAPYLKDRPVVLTRFPDGIDGKSFYQKNAPSFTPGWVETLRVEDTDYFVCNTVETLLYVANSGAIPLHVWHSRKGALDQPDWCVLDLDPKEAPHTHVIEVARAVHALLDEVCAAHVIKTSGQRGLHILIPVRGLVAHNQSKMLGELLARVVAMRLPEIATVERVVGARGNRVYLDYLQNGFGKLIAGIYSVRPRNGAPVSFPVSWDDVTPQLDPGSFTIRTAVERLKVDGDPCLRVLDEPIDLEYVLTALTEALS